MRCGVDNSLSLNISLRLCGRFVWLAVAYVGLGVVYAPRQACRNIFSFVCVFFFVNNNNCNQNNSISMRAGLKQHNHSNTLRNLKARFLRGSCAHWTAPLCWSQSHIVEIGGPSPYQFSVQLFEITRGDRMIRVRTHHHQLQTVHGDHRPPPVSQPAASSGRRRLLEPTSIEQYANLIAMHAPERGFGGHVCII